LAGILSIWKIRAVTALAATGEDTVRRRNVIALLAATAAAQVAPCLSRAQARLPTVGYLGSESPELFASRLNAFREGLAAAGFSEGNAAEIEYRWAHGDNARLPALAAELVRARVNVISAPGSLAAALAAKASTSNIPVVFETGADPVAAKLVDSLNRPGSNVTGVTSLNAQVGPKRLESLSELLPSATRFALMINPTNPANAEATTRSLQAAASALKLQLHVLNASKAEEFDGVFAKVRELGAAGLVIANETYYAMRSEPLGALAMQFRVPAAHQSPEFTRAGGLLSYGGDVMESHRQCGFYTGRVLKGEQPANLPVQQVTKVHMAINLKSAKALGIEVPLAMSGRADEVIE
jgi:putative ABC transport system substrate-binding protein